MIIRQDALEYEGMMGWKNLMKKIIDKGINIMRQIAKKEQTGELGEFIN
jgi:hypothetical protein